MHCQYCNLEIHEQDATECPICGRTLVPSPETEGGGESFEYSVAGAIDGEEGTA